MEERRHKKRERLQLERESDRQRNKRSLYFGGQEHKDVSVILFVCQKKINKQRTNEWGGWRALLIYVGRTEYFRFILFKDLLLIYGLKIK